MTARRRMPGAIWTLRTRISMMRTEVTAGDPGGELPCAPVLC
jgi:hypothetical protein